MKDELLWIAVGAFLIGAIASTLTIYATHRHYHEIIKTNIGEFMLRDNKVYGVYEMTRDVQGNMVSK
jgi:carbon starvation protein CstA